MTALTVVLPCAGRGARLGLPFPKELLPTGDGRVLIDHTLALLAGHDVQVVLAAALDRQITVAYLATRYPGLAVAVVTQRPGTAGWIGAVRAALPFVTDRVLVLLPDQVPQEPPADDPIGQADTALVTADACLLAAWYADPERLGADGALTVQSTGDGVAGRLRRITDKPGPQGAAGHNAVWFGVGFRRAAADALLAQMQLAEQRSLDAEALQGSPLQDAPVIEVPPFLDCGTWPRVRSLWSTLTGEVAACG